MPRRRAMVPEAVDALPDVPLLRVELAETQLEASPDATVASSAISSLKDAVKNDDSNADAWHELGVAKAVPANVGEASLALAEEALLDGDINLALTQARRASELLPRGSPSWIRADDITHQAKSDKDRHS